MALPDIDAVGALIDDIAQTVILPRFRHLLLDDILSKPTPTDPDDVVTIVDREAEKQLEKALKALVSSAAILGEEAAHERPDMLRLVASDGPLWVIDPIDGTRNFARGDDGFGIMVAFVVGGRTQAAWITLPARGQTFVAEAGGGALRNGVPIQVPQTPLDGPPRGALLVRHMPDVLRATVTKVTSNRFRLIPPSGCSAVEYTDVLAGARDFAVYYRLLPWDHAAPALILTEAGGCVTHLDGSPYSVRSGDQVSVSARSRAVADEVRTWLGSGV